MLLIIVSALPLMSSNPNPNQQVQYHWFKANPFFIYLPGQTSKHPIISSVEFPGHGFPPNIGGGMLHCRYLLINDPPSLVHCRGHDVQSLHGDQDPSVFDSFEKKCLFWWKNWEKMFVLMKELRKNVCFDVRIERKHKNHMEHHSKFIFRFGKLTMDVLWKIKV